MARKAKSMISEEEIEKRLIEKRRFDMNKVVELFDKTFGVNINGCPWGLCTENFLLIKAVETIEKSELNTKDKENLIKLFNENMYHSEGIFSNGKHAGIWYINIIKEYFKYETYCKNNVEER